MGRDEDGEDFRAGRMRLVPALVLAVLALGACGGGGGDEGGPREVVVVSPPVAQEPTEDEPPVVDPPVVDPPVVDPPVVEPPPTVLRQADLNVRFPADERQSDIAEVWLGIIDVFQVEPRPLTSGDITVRLLRYNEPATMASHINFYTESNDTCEVRDISGEGGGSGSSTRRVNGGEELTLSSAGGEWLRVPFSNRSESYETEIGAFPGNFPDDVTLSLPGAEFPAIDELPLAAPDAPLRLTPGIGEIITTDTEYTWVAGNSGRIRLEFMSRINGEFQGFPIICYVSDVGNVTLSQGAIEEIERRPGELTVRYLRESRWLDYRGGVMLYQNVAIAED